SRRCQQPRTRSFLVLCGEKVPDTLYSYVLLTPLRGIGMPGVVDSRNGYRKALSRGAAAMSRRAGRASAGEDAGREVRQRFIQESLGFLDEDMEIGVLSRIGPVRLKFRLLCAGQCKSCRGCLSEPLPAHRQQDPVVAGLRGPLANVPLQLNGGL